MRRLLLPIGATFALRLRHYQRRGLRVRFEARHLHCRQRGRRKQQKSKFGHMISVPDVISNRARDEQISVRPECGSVQIAFAIYFCRNAARHRVCSWPIQANLSTA
jgi:hypothetical protein